MNLFQRVQCVVYSKSNNKTFATQRSPLFSISISLNLLAPLRLNAALIFSDITGMLSKQGVQQRSGKEYHCGWERYRGKEQRSEHDDGGRALDSRFFNLIDGGDNRAPLILSLSVKWQVKYLGVRRGTFDWGELNIASFKDFDISSNVACLIDTEARVIPVLHTAFAFAFRPPALFFDTLLISCLLHYINVGTIHNLQAYLFKVPIEIFCQW